MSTIINAIIKTNLCKQSEVDAIINNAPKLRKAGDFDGKDFNQRSQTMPIAHVRNVLNAIQRYNVTAVYGDIITMLDVAKRFPECKNELRVMILAMPEIHNEHYSTPRMPSRIVKRANEIVAKAASMVDADSSGVEMGDEVLVDGQTGEVAAVA